MRFILQALLCIVAAVSLHAGDASALLPKLASDDAVERLAALRDLAVSGDPRLVPFLEDYRQGSGYLLDQRVVLVLKLSDGFGTPLDPLTRQPIGSTPVPAAKLIELDVSRRERIAATDAINRLRLTDPNPDARLAAVVRASDSGNAADRGVLAEIATSDPDPRIRRAASEGSAIIDLADSDPAIRIAACATLAALHAAGARDRLAAMSDKDPDPAAKSAAIKAKASIDSWQSGVHVAQTMFSGLSAGSILIIMALGLSITFGLMGVINMAHGEMLMIGAYATLMTQWGFERLLPAAWMPAYFPIGVVAAFICAGLVGWLIEMLVIRHLYGRPLETLLATWGVSYLLIQTVRTIFGDNQAVTAPDWLVGGWEPATGLVLPWNRIFIIVLTVLSIVGVWLLLTRTRMGLLVRATTQSRRTAASLGVNTRAIDGMTFALGSGLAGAAGAALTLIGGLKPDMGQEFIIDSFLVVATGGVGNLAGVIWSGLGLGIANKLLEPFTQAVWAKVIVLAAIILFLQWRPSGLFPAKGRLADV
jgi:urea transport system permease protein